MRYLDGILVEGSDRSQADEAYMAEVTRFNDRVNEAQRGNQVRVCCAGVLCGCAAGVL